MKARVVAETKTAPSTTIRSRKKALPELADTTAQAWTVAGPVSEMTPAFAERVPAVAVGVSMFIRGTQPFTVETAKPPASK